MARNERFRALQTEKMTGLMSSLKTKDQSLTKMVKFGLDSLDRSTALSPDDAKTDQAFKGVVEKFEAHNFIHQEGYRVLSFSQTSIS